MAASAVALVVIRNAQVNAQLAEAEAVRAKVEAERQAQLARGSEAKAQENLAEAQAVKEELQSALSRERETGGQLEAAKDPAW